MVVNFWSKVVKSGPAKSRAMFTALAPKGMRLHDGMVQANRCVCRGSLNVSVRGQENLGR